MFSTIQQLSFATRWLLRTLLAIALGVSLSSGHAAPSQAASSSTGTIAYTDTSSIHLINPDGSNDHVIYTVPNTTNNRINELAWSPDGSQVAFISDQEAVTSFYEADVYAIRPNGTDFRKITNSPSVTQLASFPKGTVTLDVQVWGGMPGPIFIYVAGAPAAQALVPGSGGTFHFTFLNVADFGAHNQPVVAIFGYDRWFQAGIAPDVIPNTTVYAGTLSNTLYGSMTTRIDHLSWKADGSALGYVYGNCAQLVNISSNPSPGDFDNVILNPTVLGFTCIMDYAAKLALANQLLYYEYDVTESHVYRATEGQAGNGTLVYTFPNNGALRALHWLPDGSGFVYSQEDDLAENSNLYLVKFGNANPTQLTSYTSQYTGQFSISPDGESSVYELSSTSDGPTSLRILDIASLLTRQLVNQGARPTWGSYIPVNYNHFLFLPALFR